MLQFKYDKLEDEFDAVEDRLQCIVYSLSGYIEHKFGKHLILTSVYRNQTGSVHKYWRGVDFRVTPYGGKSIYTDEELQSIKDYLQRFVYDNERPNLNSLRIHDAGSGLHGHIQVMSGNVTTIREIDA